MATIGAEFAAVALQKVGEMVVRQTANEASLVLNFTRDFEWLKKQLTHVKGYLQDAYTQSTHNDSTKQWIQDVLEIAFQAEDILEEYQVKSLYRPDRTVSQSCWCSPHEIVVRYKMGRRIREIKRRIRSIAKDAQQMNLLYAASSLQQQPASTSTFQRESWTSSLLERDSRAVAIDHKVDEMQNLLGDPEVQVIAVVGMGGVGKTFLVKHLYNKVKDTFENSIWLSVSQTYSLLQLQHDLAFRLDLKDAIISGVSSTQLVELIHARLLTATSLIVLDDVWRASQQHNLIEGLGLPVGSNNKCKVVVTTRNREVCRNARIYQMKHLSKEDSWELFCAYAFFDGQQNTPPAHLEQIAGEIAKECAKLPLAIKTVASSMAEITLPIPWEAKLCQLQKAIEGNPTDPIIDIIKLSYERLPTSLKTCFAYFSFFPEDEVIDCEYLVYVWMAEGFIPHADAGWDYLRQFVNLCLVEVWEKDYSMIKRCKLHDFILDLAVSISKENRCIFTIEEAFRRHSGCLRVLLGKQGLQDDAIADSNFSRHPFVRTLSLFKNSFLKNISPKLFSQLRVLRVLDLSHTALSSLPQSIGNLKLLRVLNLSYTKIKQIPECVANLKSHRFLDVSLCEDLVEVPPWIGELTCLQHFNIRFCSEQFTNRIPPKGISKLLSLQTLRSHGLELSIEENENELLKLKDLANLTKLRELRIKVKHQVEMRMLEESILAHMVHMRILEIRNELETACLAETMKVMKDLEQLFLYSFALPSWIHGFTNLEILYLEDCDCSDYSALSLETMPNSTILAFVGNKRCRRLPKAFGKSEAFPKLRYLNLSCFNALEEFWEEWEDGAMTARERLCVLSCPKIKNVPRGLEQLKSLKKLAFEDSGTKEVRERLKEGGEEWRKIKAHNPPVRIVVE